MYIGILKYYSDMKNNEILSFATDSMDLEATLY